MKNYTCRPWCEDIERHDPEDAWCASLVTNVAALRVYAATHPDGRPGAYVGLDLDDGRGVVKLTAEQARALSRALRYRADQADA